MSTRHLHLIVVAAILGCATNQPATGTPIRTATYLTADEITDKRAESGTAYDAVARLRPNWLAVHGIAAQGSQYAVVFLDGQKYGDLTSLRNIPAYSVGDIRYYDITQAGAVFGIKGDTGGVIEVRSKK